MSIGMDTGWFASFMDAYFDSFASGDIPIWRVFKSNPVTGRVPISAEQELAQVWEQIEYLRKTDPDSRYDFDHSIKYRKPA